jgi:hypothetical protein
VAAAAAHSFTVLADVEHAPVDACGVESLDRIRGLTRRGKGDHATTLGTAVLPHHHVRVHHLTRLPEMVLEVLPARLECKVVYEDACARL